MEQRRFSPEDKLKIVLAAYSHGDGTKENGIRVVGKKCMRPICSDYNISTLSLRLWAKKLDKSAHLIFGRKNIIDNNLSKRLREENRRLRGVIKLLQTVSLDEELE